MADDYSWITNSLSDYSAPSGWDYGPGNVGDSASAASFVLGDNYANLGDFYASLGAFDNISFDGDPLGDFVSKLNTDTGGGIKGSLNLSNLGTLLERDGIGGTLMRPIQLGDGSYSQQVFNAAGDPIGFRRPLDENNLGITGYYSPYNSVLSDRPDYSNVDLYATANDAALSDRAKLQYELSAKQKAGDMFLEDPNDIARYAKAYRNDVLSTALGGVNNPINETALKLAGVPDAVISKLKNIPVGTSSNRSTGGAGSVLSKLADIVKAAKAGTMVAKAIEGQKPVPRVARGTAAPVKWTYQGPRQVKFAEGGEVQGGLSSVSSGQGRLVPGNSKGQDDKVHAKLSSGEYVFDAETVSALGDGNTEAGAKELDKMRENIRAHKRGGSVKTIPPKAKKPAAYMKGSK